MENIDWFYSLKGQGIKLGLDRVRKLLSKIGNVEKDLKYIHVAGTNGKGSVCAMVSSILISAGYKVGMYTSPHLVRFNERYLVNGCEISDEKLDELIGRLRRIREDETYFELGTVLAFLYFKEEKVSTTNSVSILFLPSMYNATIV